MRIATWNIERLKHNKQRELMLQEIEKVNADILILTETDSRLKPDYPYCFQTPPLGDETEIRYRDTENRITVFSKYGSIGSYKTHDELSSICVELETENGSLLVYGTIIGIYGNRNESFYPELIKQMDDIKRLTACGKKLCVVGDYNLSFCDNYYFTDKGRQLVIKTFDECGIEIITKGLPQCIDHIAISKDFFRDVIAVSEWNMDKSLSDHKGSIIEISF